MVLIKILTTVGIVLVLSVVAERAGPRMAGVLSGYPLGVALSLFFIGLEISPEFAAQSAVYAIAGLCATQAFVWVYYLASRRIRRGCIVASTLAATAGYFAAAAALRPIPFNRAGALSAAFGAMAAFTMLFRRIPDARIAHSVRFTPAVFALRALLAALIIVAVTAAAQAVGPAWAGLFSAFPIALYPLLLIVHLTYDKAHVHTIIKHFPRGMGAIAVYALCVSWAYPAWGIGWGTAAAFAAATVYLGAFVFWMSRRRPESARREGCPQGGAMDAKLLTLIDTAIRREEEAYAFYRELRGRVADEASREAIDGIAEEEKKHKEFLEQYRQGGFETGELRLSDPVYYRIAEHQQEPEVRGDLSRPEVFLIAAHRELRSHRFYSALAAEHGEGPARQLLARMATEELRHKEKMEYLYANTAFPQTSGG